MTNIGAVIGWKFNHQEGMTTRDGVITEFPNGIPSQADQDKWTKEYEEHLASTKYKQDRATDYPDIGNQLDMQYWDKKNGTNKWVEAIDKVKSDNPKP